MKQDVLSAAWDDLAIACSPQVILNSTWLISFWIDSAEWTATEAISKFNHLSIRLSPAFFQQIAPNSLLPGYEAEVMDSGMLHLAQLLHTEMQQPQVLSQMFVGSIVSVLILYLVSQQDLNIVAQEIGIPPLVQLSKVNTFKPTE